MEMLRLIKEAQQKLLGRGSLKAAEPESNYYAGPSEDTLSRIAKVAYDPNRYCLRATHATGTPIEQSGKRSGTR